MKSSLKNMICVLTGICLVTSCLLGLVNNVTAEPIAAAQLQKKTAALSAVLPYFNNDPIAEMTTVTVDEADGSHTLTVYSAALDGVSVGCAVESSSVGFGGEIRLMTGFNSDGSIVNIQVLGMSETPGLGANMTKEGNSLTESFVGKNAGSMRMTVRQDGGDVDALTAATISSRAYSKAVETAYHGFVEFQKTLKGGIDE